MSGVRRTFAPLAIGRQVVVERGIGVRTIRRDGRDVRVKPTVVIVGESAQDILELALACGVRRGHLLERTLLLNQGASLVLELSLLVGELALTLFECLHIALGASEREPGATHL